MSERMITVRLFAAAAEAAGVEEVRVELPEEARTVGDVVDVLPGLLRGQADVGSPGENLPAGSPALSGGGEHGGSAKENPGRGAAAPRGSSPSLERVCLRSSFLLNERRARAETSVSAGDVLDVLPPFAGG